ncbi:NAD(P)-dependent glycerol-1-phosphate dehydrogenase [Methanomethylophilus alvi]|uniref:NAD(P)-dependent glycerol-1-phosphate dehydrogenase n=1 Tax=Methanomethylophilus alvi TaxID=1291540 RepID=UPI00033E2507|nr:NAD(P)-dependent glycerol-1-phosphate dehydrogenase [Methanomethylophilus alvi]MDD7480978.1 NAD(P)-dependent glycerol-1-phosphate dehydrogenase [Methanomethylophilus alvi]CDF30584.1 glycerol-1-phosphate dehydrogenase [NAD(P)+] 1 [Methanoculleus sp. CAG:1088]
MAGEFTKARTMNFPRTTVFGHNVLEQTADICRSLLFGEDGIIITGRNTYEAAGKQVEDLVSEHFNVAPVFTDGCDHDNVEKAKAAAKEMRSTFILAIGGGSKIDTAKLVSNDLGIPFVSIPTSIAHDGICSDRASMKNEEGAPLTVQACPPMAVIADTGVLVKAPYRFLASGCADVISNMTALKDWDFARKIKDEEFSTSAYTMAHYAAESLINNSTLIKPGLEESIWLVLKPVIASGVSMCIAGSSRPTSGSEHMFSHALDLLHPGKALHGEQCGVGCIMMMCLHGGDWKQIRDALKNIGAPTTAAELGLSSDDVVDALVAANKVRKDRFTILGENGLTRNAALNLARTTGVI